MASLFSALILAQWRGEWEGKHTLVPALSAAIVAAIGLYVLPAGWNIVVAALAGGLAGALIHGR